MYHKKVKRNICSIYKDEDSGSCLHEENNHSFCKNINVIEKWCVMVFGESRGISLISFSNKALHICASAPSQVLIWPERCFHQGWIKRWALKPCHTPATGTPSQQPLIYKQHFTSAQRYELDCRIESSIWAKQRVNFTWAKRSRPQREPRLLCLC